MHFRKLINAVAASFALAGCQGVSPVLDTAGSMFASFDSKKAYQPGFEYLQVQVDGRQAAMALGQRDSDGRNTHEYWYSGQREMLYLKNGRIYQAIGTTREIRDQFDQAPDWEQLLQARGPYVWQRSLDVQPGYRSGVKEYLVTQRVTPSLAQQRRIALPAEWFEDTVTGKSEDGGEWTYKQVFALIKKQVVYSEQCLAPELCFSLLHLGAVRP